MLLLAVMAICLAAVPLAGGRLSMLADLSFRNLWILLIALVVKFAVILVFPQDAGAIHGAVHVAAYLVAGYFLWTNRQLPGFWLITLGGGMNLAAIAANGGVMPASSAAFASAGLTVTPGEFSNSAPIADPNLSFLGDIFATPASWPFHNVFSIGDICILLGVAIAMHRLSGSRLVPSGSGQFTGLLENRNFMRVWGGQAVSNLGDWVYTLAVMATVAAHGGGAHTLAILLVVQVAPAALSGLLGGPLIDRLPRKGLMVSMDLLRAVAVCTLLLAGDPSLGHMYAVAAFLGVCGSLFQPAFQASVPNLVAEDRIVAANALVSASYNTAVMAGPVIGGLLVAKLGPTPAFALNAVSFLVSAALLVRARIPRTQLGRSPQPAGEPSPSPLKDLIEGFRYSITTPLVRGAFLVLGMVMVSSTLRTPLEPLFVIHTLGLRPEALGLVGGAWGLGMLLGSIAAPAASRRWRRDQMLSVSIAVIGGCVVLAAGASSLSPLLFAWLLSGAANGIGSVAYDSLLQERTPDALRGRVMAASEAVFQAAFLVGVLLSGWFGTTVGIRPTFAVSGALLLVTAVLCRMLLRGLRGRHRAGGLGLVPSAHGRHRSSTQGMARRPALTGR